MALITEWYSNNVGQEAETNVLQKVKNGGTPGNAQRAEELQWPRDPYRRDGSRAGATRPVGIRGLRARLVVVYYIGIVT